MSDSSPGFSPVTVLERELNFRTPTSIQAALLHRNYKIMDVASTILNNDKATKEQTEQATQQTLEAMGKVLDLLGSLLPPMDEQWVANMMLTGKIDDDMLLKMLADLLPDDEEEQVPVKQKRARRG